MSLHKRIKELRKQLHLSQDYVARYLGINRATYTQMENGKRKVLAEEVAKLSTLFGVATDSLLNDANMDNVDEIEVLAFVNAAKQMKQEKQNEE